MFKWIGAIAKGVAVAGKYLGRALGILRDVEQVVETAKGVTDTLTGKPSAPPATVPSSPRSLAPISRKN